MKHETYMKIAYDLASESKCVSVQVGAVFVRDGRIISTGINGSVAGQKNCCDHAKEMGWLHTPNEIKVPKNIMVEYVNNRNGFRMITSKDIPHGTTHITYSVISDSVTFLKVFGDDMYLYSKTPPDVWSWNKMAMKASHFNMATKSSLNVIWTNPNWKHDANAVEIDHDKIGKLNQDFRQQHHEWANEHENHAEMNGLIFAAKHGVSLKDSTMYVTVSPCKLCVKMLAQSGVKEVYYSELYDKNPPDWASKLISAGIPVKQIKVS